MCAERVTIQDDKSTRMVSLSTHIVLEADP
jgi:hypothetical protein